MSKSTLKSDSLAFALLGAAQAVAMVRKGTALPQALADVFSQVETPPQARGAIQDIAYRTMRQLGRVEALIGAMITKAPEPALLHGLVCCSLALISNPDDTPETAPYNAFTVVDQAVTAATSDLGIAHAKGMVNAVLRRFLRERDALLTKVMQDPVAFWNYPAWWIDAAKAAYPRDWEALLKAGNAAPPLTLRVNQRKSTVAEVMNLLAASSMNVSQIGPQALRMEQAVPVSQLPGFMDGLVSVQDAAAQLAAPLLDIQSGMRVLDACAAPGGKTCHILESVDARVVALDNDPKRLKRITENLDRLKLRATLVSGDAASPDWWDGRPFHRILADVPCTASGIVRRHPDIRWLRRKVDAAQLATLSARILDNLWQMLLPDGKLLFVTCSIWPQESEAQAAAFAVRNNAIRLDAPGQLLPPIASDQDHDGLFFALFQKPSS